MSQQNWGTQNVALHSVLIPFKHSGTTRCDWSLTPTLLITNHSKTLQKNNISAAFLLLVYWSSCPWSQSSSSDWSVMPDNAGRVSKRCERCWDAGITLVVPGYPLSFRDSSKLPQSQVLLSRAGLAFRLFYWIMENTKVSSKIPLPHYITVYNAN